MDTEPKDMGIDKVRDLICRVGFSPDMINYPEEVNTMETFRLIARENCVLIEALAEAIRQRDKAYREIKRGCNNCIHLGKKTLCYSDVCRKCNVSGSQWKWDGLRKKNESI